MEQNNKIINDPFTKGLEMMESCPVKKSDNEVLKTLLEPLDDHMFFSLMYMFACNSERWLEYVHKLRGENPLSVMFLKSMTSPEVDFLNRAKNTSLREMGHALNEKDFTLFFNKLGYKIDNDYKIINANRSFRLSNFELHLPNEPKFIVFLRVISPIGPENTCLRTKKKGTMYYLDHANVVFAPPSYDIHRDPSENTSIPHAVTGTRCKNSEGRLQPVIVNSWDFFDVKEYDWIKATEKATELSTQMQTDVFKMYVYILYIKQDEPHVTE